VNKQPLVCGTEGRGFKSRRSPQIFQALRESPLARNALSVHAVSIGFRLVGFSVHHGALGTHVLQREVRVSLECHYRVAIDQTEFLYDCFRIPLELLRFPIAQRRVQMATIADRWAFGLSVNRISTF
jgi:hypothetical protein